MIRELTTVDLQTSREKKPRVAIVCDWLVTIGGAEKVLYQMLNCIPTADLFSLIDFVSPSERHFLHHKKVTTSFIQRLPGAKKYYRHYLPLMPLAIEQFDLSAYDIIISSAHAVAKGIITGPDQLHLCYTHSPMRYAWDLQSQYLAETGLATKWRGWPVRYLLHRLRHFDVMSANRVDHFAANSNFIARRVMKTYRRVAEVIYPPIEDDLFKPGSRKENFYLTASRLVPYKKIDLIVKTFAELPDQQLIVIGDGPDLNKIKDIATTNVKVLGYQDTNTLIDHMQRARAFIFAAQEDFGIIPLEAQACGTPIIAFGKGGALETVNGLEANTPTGVFFHQQSVAAIADAINTFNASTSIDFTANCVLNAQRFSSTNFKHGFLQFIEKHWQTFQKNSAIA